jgi:predicted GTPase
VQITITGPRGCGKTTVALEVAKFLRERGCIVDLVGPAPDFLETESQSEPNPESMRLPIPITIVDSFETMDELELKNIARDNP